MLVLKGDPPTTRTVPHLTVYVSRDCSLVNVSSYLLFPIINSSDLRTIIDRI